MKELDERVTWAWKLNELLNWVWKQYSGDTLIIERYWRDYIDGNSPKHPELRAAEARVEAYSRVIQKIWVLQERNQK